MINDGDNITLTFYETEQNAIDELLPIQNPQNYTNETPEEETLWVVATNTLTGCKGNPQPFTIYIVPSPVDPDMLDSLPDLVLCDEDANDQDFTTVFDLTQQDDVIETALEAEEGELTITYFTTVEDAEAGAPMITSPVTYTGTDGQVIYVRIENNTSECHNVLSFVLQVGRPLELTTPPMFTVCNTELPNTNPQTEVFDLTTQNNTILGPMGIGQGYTVEYYEEEEDALDDANAIATPTTYTNLSTVQTLYVGVTSPEGCRSYTTLTLKVLPLPTPDTEPDALVSCDDDATADTEIFDLTDAEADIRDNDNTTTITYHVTMEDAEAGINPIPDPSAHESASGTVYVRVEANTNNPDDPNCYVVVNLELIVNPLPALGDAVDIAPYAICEPNTDGFASFDLNTHNDEVLGGADTTGYTFTYFASEAAANAGFPAIQQEDWTNTTMTEQELWVTVVNQATGCTITDSFMIYVEEQAIANDVDDVLLCDQLDGVNDGIANYDLTQFSATVLGPDQPQGEPGEGLYVVEYYTEDPQANPDAAPIADPANFRNEGSPEMQTIYIRVYNDGTISKCSDYTTVDIHVELLPIPTLAGGTICVDYNTGEVIRTHTLDTGLDATHTFVWTFNGTPIAGATGPTYEATAQGSYNVTATSANGCVSVPIAPVMVEQSGPASLVGTGYTVSNYFSDEQVITVTVEGHGTYEYRIDDGPWQESNIFTNVSAGDHQVQVRDITACSEFVLTLEGVSTVDYPKYFTPNGDGYHDTWNIEGFGDENTDARIYIFDRYGKLVKQISSQGDGWDGTMNGTLMPATDYWFKAIYRETVNGVETIKEFKAHFSLKR
jgi:large repetitive protein